MARATFDPITLEILWTRLVSIVDEASATFVRTAFSTLVQESNDYAVVLIDLQGRSLAQSTLSIPSFIGTLPRTVGHLIDKFPVDTLRPGDVLITNNPWMGTGHLPDINIAIPLFRKGRPVAFAAATSHMPNIGGRTWNAGIRELYEEGLQIPRLKLIEEGRVNQTVVDFIRENVRVPDLTMGDVWGEVSACHMLSERLMEMLDQTDVDIATLGTEIQTRSEAAMRAAIGAIPDGTYQSRIENDVGFEEPLIIQCCIKIRGESMQIDCAGSTRQLPYAVNSVPNYTFAYTCFGVKAALSPELPNNDGAYRPVTVTAPEGSLLNPRYPAACTTRGMVGQLLPPAVMTALAQAIPEKVLAPPGSPQCSFMISGTHGNRSLTMISFVAGGMGAGADQNGMSPMSFPSNVANTPIEVMEALMPIHIHHREIRRGAGGAGRQKGGDGQRIEFSYHGDGPAVATTLMNRMKHPAPGILGGKPGAVARVRVNGRPRTRASTGCSTRATA